MVKKTKQNTPADPQIALLTQKVAEAESNYLRVLADYQNQERRRKDQEIQIVKMANASLIEKILFVVDSLKLAQTHLQDKGLSMILDQFVKILESEGLKKIETENLPFDPISMDCSEIVPGEKDLVIENVSDGYLLFDKVLRPAKVRVGSGTNSHPHESGDPSGDPSTPPVIASRRSPISDRESEAMKQSHTN